MKVALAQIRSKLGDPDSNLARHLEIVRRLSSRSADLVVFPELSLTGYLLQDLVPEMAEPAGSGRRLKALAAASRRAGIVAGFVERGPEHRDFNAAGCFHGGRLIGLHRKVHLPTYGMFDEGRYFAAGDAFRAFDAPWGRTGLLVCEDFWHLSASWLLSLQGMDLLVVISAGPVKGLDGSGRVRSAEIWVDLARVVARHLSCWVVYVNRVGYEEGWAYQGGSFVCDPSGEVAARARDLKEEILVARLPERCLRTARIASPLLREERADLVLRELGRIAREGGARPAGEPGGARGGR
jgi:NAD+ synthase (glutamine-hydrolysing)